MNSLFQLVLFFISFPAFSNAQSIHYDILLFGDKIGNMNISREEKAGGIEFYVLESSSKAKILWINKSNTTRYEVTYKDGKLISSSHKETENGKVTRWTDIKWDGAKYLVDSYKGSRTFTEVPTYSVVTIYFKDIKNVKRIFYESEADYDLITHPEPDTWEFKSSDGNRNVYHYQNGVLQSTEFHVSIATVKMVRTN
jgi:hypothetical protein